MHVEPVQAVFDVESGEFRGQAHADGGAAGTADAHPDAAPTHTIREAYGDAAGEVLDDLASLDLAETPPVEVVSELQRLLDALDDG